MTLAELRTELQARGGARLETGVSTRTDSYLNRAYGEISDEEDWPFLLTTQTTAPTAGAVAITDLRTVESVVITSTQTKLRPGDPRDLLDYDTSLTTSGTPYVYYTTSTGISVYPVSTASVTIRYYKVPALLSAGTDTPLFPARFHTLIVDQAMRYVYLDADAFDAAAAIQPIIDETKARMRDALIDPQHDRPGAYVVSVTDHADATW